MTAVRTVLPDGCEARARDRLRGGLLRGGLGPDADDARRIRGGQAHLHRLARLERVHLLGLAHGALRLGHVMLGLRRVQEALARARLRLPEDVESKLEHAVLSHHGELEWGSPKRPATLEALLLHHADNLDAKAAGFCALLAGASAVEEVWTDASNLFRRPLYAPRAAADERALHGAEGGG